MAGEIEYKEDVVSNICDILNAICTDLQSAENNLNGIDAEANSLEIANLNTSQVQDNINASYKKINNTINNINSLLAEFDANEEKNTEIILEYIKNIILDGEFEVKITDKGFELWKEDVEYVIKIETINNHKCFILEPEYVDPNIPTVFFLDGYGSSAVSGIKDENTIAAIESCDGGKASYGENGRKNIPLTGINYGGLTKPNARFIYLPNNGTYWCNTDITVFEGIVGELVNKCNIDTDKMTIVGHSARGICSSKICSRNCRKICK